MLSNISIYILDKLKANKYETTANLITPWFDAVENSTNNNDIHDKRLLISIGIEIKSGVVSIHEYESIFQKFGLVVSTFRKKFDFLKNTLKKCDCMSNDELLIILLTQSSAENYYCLKEGIGTMTKGSEFSYYLTDKNIIESLKSFDKDKKEILFNKKDSPFWVAKESVLNEIISDTLPENVAIDTIDLLGLNHFISPERAGQLTISEQPVYYLILPKNLIITFFQPNSTNQNYGKLNWFLSYKKEDNWGRTHRLKEKKISDLGIRERIFYELNLDTEKFEVEVRELGKIPMLTVKDDKVFCNGNELFNPLTDDIIKQGINRFNNI